MAEERSQLISEDEKEKGELRERRRMFEEEAAKLDHSKVEKYSKSGNGGCYER